MSESELVEPTAELQSDTLIARVRRITAEIAPLELEQEAIIRSAMRGQRSIEDPMVVQELHTNRNRIGALWQQVRESLDAHAKVDPWYRRHRDAEGGLVGEVQRLRRMAPAWQSLRPERVHEEYNAALEVTVPTFGRYPDINDSGYFGWRDNFFTRAVAYVGVGATIGLVAGLGVAAVLSEVLEFSQWQFLAYTEAGAMTGMFVGAMRASHRTGMHALKSIEVFSKLTLCAIDLDHAQKKAEYSGFASRLRYAADTRQLAQDNGNAVVH